jgi:hypothetical protein
LSDGYVFSSEKLELTELIVSLVILSRAWEESERKSLRIRDVRERKRRAAREHLKPMGGQIPGWLRETRDGFEVIEDRAEVVRMIFRDCANGIGPHRLEARLNEKKVPTFNRRKKVWNRSFIRVLLSGRAVLGEMQPHRSIKDEKGKNVRVPDGDPIEGFYPAVVTEDLWYAAQEGIRSRRGTGGPVVAGAVPNLFAGKLARCAYCGSGMTYVNKGKGTYLVCENARRNLGCVRKTWNYRDLETSVLSFVIELDLRSITRKDDGRRATLDAQIAATRGRISELKERRETFYHLMTRTKDVDFVARGLDGIQVQLERLEAELAEHEQARRGLEPDRNALEDTKLLIDKLQREKDHEAFALRSAIRAKLRSVVDAILVSPAGSREGLNPWLKAFKVGEDARYFVVRLRGGDARIVVPSADDPARFDLQLVGGEPSGGIEVVTPRWKQRLRRKD